jgi:hypothetical protein
MKLKMIEEFGLMKKALVLNLQDRFIFILYRLGDFAYKKYLISEPEIK